jgi:hypothetical protein
MQPRHTAALILFFDYKRYKKSSKSYGICCFVKIFCPSFKEKIALGGSGCAAKKYMDRIPVYARAPKMLFP